MSIKEKRDYDNRSESFSFKDDRLRSGLIESPPRQKITIKSEPLDIDEDKNKKLNELIGTIE